MLKFRVGEVQYVSATARAETQNEIAVINSAHYKLMHYEDKTVIDEGNCEVEGNMLRVLLTFLEEGLYTLSIKAQIGKEIIIKDKAISVTR